MLLRQNGNHFLSRIRFVPTMKTSVRQLRFVIYPFSLAGSTSQRIWPWLTETYELLINRK